MLAMVLWRSGCFRGLKSNLNLFIIGASGIFLTLLAVHRGSAQNLDNYYNDSANRSCLIPISHGIPSSIFLSRLSHGLACSVKEFNDMNNSLHNQSSGLDKTALKIV